MLRAAFAAEDPIIFLEHKHLLRQPYTVDPFPPADYVVPFGKGTIDHEGDSMTIVSYGATLERTRKAVAQLGVEDEVELIDLRWIIPWDHELVAQSVAKTGRCLVVHEDVITCGFGAEVAAWIGEHCFESLDAPVRRVAAIDTHVAYEPTLEAAVLPQVDDIATAIKDLLAY
jgi:2-oxoisovalerate dehydrogenase E1 component